MQNLKYPLAIRVLHWIMGVIILGMLAGGLYMVSMNDETTAKFELFYPYHKSFGMLILFLAVIRLGVRINSSSPSMPAGLARWEVIGAKIAHVALYALMIIVPIMGYSMSSSFTQSDGVFFFGAMLPELLPKNDDNFEIFQAAHRILAYGLLGLIVLHVGAALKHRFFDRGKDADVLPRIL